MSETPIPLSRAKGLGDFVTWHGVNGHRYEGYVRQIRDGRAWSPGVNDSWHADSCGCWAEPWEYEPEGLY